MTINHNNPGKTIGRQTARLLASLYDRAQSMFTLGDAQGITGLSSRSASSLLHKAVRRGVVSRLKPRVFVIVPPELGSASDYAGDPYLTAKRLAGSAPCFISHASAMEIHRMVTNAPWHGISLCLHPAGALLRNYEALGHKTGAGGDQRR